MPKIVEAIEVKGGTCEIYMNEWMNRPRDVTLDAHIECIITVGGDGTMISAAKTALKYNIPLVGVNGGHLGYLCDLDEYSVFGAVENLIRDNFSVEERMLLSGSIGGRSKKDGIKIEALNDIVISSYQGLQVIYFRVYINGELLYSFNGDGMIFATATGSTAYNLSAHGPIVDPKADVILMTPINPHTLNTRSIVLDPADEITLEITKRHREDEPQAAVSVDGVIADTLTPDKMIFVTKAADKVKMIRFTDMSFLERIRRKMRLQ